VCVSIFNSYCVWSNVCIQYYSIVCVVIIDILIGSDTVSIDIVSVSGWSNVILFWWLFSRRSMIFSKWHYYYCFLMFVLLCIHCVCYWRWALLLLLKLKVVMMSVLLVFYLSRKWLWYDSFQSGIIIQYHSVVIDISIDMILFDIVLEAVDMLLWWLIVVLFIDHCVWYCNHCRYYYYSLLMILLCHYYDDIIIIVDDWYDVVLCDDDLSFFPTWSNLIIIGDSACVAVNIYGH